MELHEIDYKVPEGKLIRLRAQLEDNRFKEIKINGRDFDEERYRATVENDALLLWLNVNNATLLTVEIKVEL